MRLSRLLPLLVAPLVCLAADRPLALGELTGRVRTQALFVAGPRKVRLAVAPFTAAGEGRWRDRGFGAYLTEQVFSALGQGGTSLRLFERARLDAVLKEQKLSASGLFTEDDAKRLGELVPLDLLLTGTFTRLEGSIAIHGRFIDVVSGEIPATFRESLALTPDLLALFEDRQAVAPAVAATAAPAPKVDPCAEVDARLEPLMEDLGSPEKVERLVAAVVAVPWEPPCGAVHPRLVQLLLRHRLRSARYGAYLHRTLGAVQDPDRDDRWRTVLRYLKADGDLEPEVWRTAFGVLSRSARFTDHLGTLLRPADRTQVDLPRLLDRSGEILTAVARQRIGKPVPLTTGEVFTAIFADLAGFYGQGTRDRNLAPVLAFYRTYGPRHAPDGDRRLVSRLLDLLRGLPPGAERTQLLGWLGERVARFGDPAPLATDLAVFMDRLVDQRKEERRKGRWEGPAAQELGHLAEVAGPTLVGILPHLQGRQYRLNTQAFGLEFGLKGPGVPTEAELLAQVEGEDRTAQAEGLRLLAALGPRAKGAEAVALRLLRRAEATRDWDSAAKYHLRDVLELLAACGARSPEAHRQLIRLLGSLESHVSEGAILALARLGPTVIAALQEAYPRQEHLVKMRMAKAFELMGAAGRPALPWLKARMAEKESGHLAIAFEDAIARIETAP